jgi:hypothetical protein
MTRQTREERFWAKVQKTNKCWEWTAYRSKKGYGAFGYDAHKIVAAHRYSLLTALGLPMDTPGMVCHHCDNPSCVRPSHLYLGNNSTNQQDAVRRGRWSSGNCKKTNCKRGHKFTDSNTRINVRGERVCRTCDRLMAAEYRKRKRALQN